jgi:predicted small metal-binding protein
MFDLRRWRTQKPLLTRLLNGYVTYTQTCPRCGSDVRGDDREAVADAVVEHARGVHDHSLDREIVLAHLEGVHPYERED